MQGTTTETIHDVVRLHDFSSEMFDEARRLKILIVDDQIDYLELVERYVASFGYDCITAADGGQALEYLTNNPCDLVITDMLMPRMDGMELLLRIQAEFPQVATIILSGYSKVYSFKDIIHAGACEFIEKPVDKSVLKAKIERVFREKMLMASYLNEIKTQEIVVTLLALSTRGNSINELLHDFLLSITDFPGLELEPKGAVHLVDEYNHSRLILKAHHNLSEPQKEVCAQVPFGQCLCGLAAQTKKVVFADHIGTAHHHQFEGIEEHGHYCVPILLADGELLGVFTLYVKAGAIYNREAEILLRSTAKTIAALIVSKKGENQ